MKLFFAFFLALFAVTAVADNGPQGRSTAMKYDGTADSATIEKHYINVINNEGSSLAAGSIVILDATADDGASVIKDTSASQTPLCMITKACADNALCECQTYGLFDSALFNVTAGNAVAGAPFFIDTGTAGYVKKGTLGGVEIPAGIFYDAASASGAVQVFIKLR